ncbi:MAG: pantoate--beta-alanine ligase [Armatimonadetes bacterium]|nr:pantoate--beta-alanine ligase [Armatimonadota bacterium]MDE2206174.1 pantoate--beta-alanine ligase [Armatimonadota bacterium]
MRSFDTVASLRVHLASLRSDGRSVGLVPTMGALHDGHISLVRKARAECDAVVLSIFVNPSQFGPSEDYTQYPRDIARDCRLANDAGVDAVFTPSVEEMYPAGFQTVVTVPKLAGLLEGAVRPHHFAGVTTVVLKLLNIATPDRLFMGQKDYQQALIIDRMIADLNVDATMSLAPTVREADGLALSSRNAYLTAEQRQVAPDIHRALMRASEMVHGGETDPETVIEAMRNLLAESGQLSADYVVLADPGSLQNVTTLANRTALAAIAARIGSTRLIDNMLVAPAGSPPAPFGARRVETGSGRVA